LPPPPSPPASAVQLLHELAFNVGVGNHIVVNVALQWITDMGEVLLGLPGSEDIQVEGVFKRVIRQVFNHHGGLLLVNQTTSLRNKAFRVGFKLSKYSR